MENNNSVAVFGGGCFWCTEAVFQMMKGVSLVKPGYAGGTKENPTYEEISGGMTGHAEVIYLEYDPSVVGYRDLMTVFFGSHDPTTKNRQGADEGTQYRSIILTTTPEQVSDATQFILELNASSEFGDPIVTEVVPLEKFYDAEEYHKNYFRDNPNQGYCQLVINPKLEKVKHKFAELLNDESKQK